MRAFLPKGKKTLFCVSLLILAQFMVLIPIPKVYGQFESITFDVGTRTITVLGFTQSDKCKALDIWNEDNTNGWNVFKKLGDHSFAFDNICLQVGNGSIESWFGDINVQILWDNATVEQEAIYVTDNGHFSSGLLLDSERKITSKGCSFYFDNYYYIYGEEGCDFEFYDTKFVDFSYLMENYVEGNQTFYSCTFTNWYAVDVAETSNSVFWNVLIQDSGFAVYMETSPLLFDNVKVLKADHLLYIQEPFNLTDFYGRNATDESFYVSVGSGNINLINPDVDAWTFNWENPAYNLVNVFRKYQFHLTVFFQNGSFTQNANVTICNDFLGLSYSWLTYANGSIPQQVFSMGHYNATGGDTIYDYNPYNLTITFDGYETYSTLINITKKEDLKITLSESKPKFFPYFGLGVVFALMIGLIFALAFIYEKRK